MYDICMICNLMYIELPLLERSCDERHGTSALSEFYWLHEGRVRRALATFK
jgi:hypothetical protein